MDIAFEIIRSLYLLFHIFTDVFLLASCFLESLKSAGRMPVFSVHNLVVIFMA